MYELDKKKFGAFVAMLRKEKGFTQKELAERLFLSDKAISKWETGASIPDTALLIPLSELLGVSVTELLMCERMEKDAAMDSGQVEQLVKTAVSYPTKKQARAFHGRNKWIFPYLAALLTGAAGLIFLHAQNQLPEAVYTAFLLSAVFGAYFCLFVKTRLPSFYDEHRMELFYDGPLRMHLPGLSLNNQNWPHIVRAARLWSCLSLPFFPALALLMNVLAPKLWMRAGNYVILILSLGGLFLPIYAAGKKHEGTKTP